MKYKIYPYKMGSRSAKDLAKGLGVLRVRPDGRYKGRNSHIVINWGNSRVPNWYSLHWLNPPWCVEKACDKRLALIGMKSDGVQCPDFYVNKLDAYEALKEGRIKRLFGRAILNGHSGRGITIFTDPEELRDHPALPLYTVGIPKDVEYRVHVFRDEIVHVQQKKKKIDRPAGGQEGVRNHANGWAFCINEIAPPSPLVLEQAMDAVAALDLDFGAVDIVTEIGSGEPYVLEVNTAFGLEGTTLDKWIEAYKNYLGNF